MVSRKPSLVPDGVAVPRIEARLARVTIDRKHLAAYAEICGAAAGPTLPIAYPHILATPLHLAMRIADRVCELGRFGQKTGLGWYRYEAGKREAIPDPLVDQIIDEERKALGMKVRRLPDAEIIDRLLYALVNEGAKILEEGIALRASDIDVVYLTGYGFPVQRGGPMFHAGR